MRNFKKALVFILVIAMSCSSLQLFSVAQTSTDTNVVYSMSFASISDVHYYALYSEEDSADDPGLFDASGAVLQTAIETLVANAIESNLKYVLLPGDLTKEAEYDSHVALAAALESYEEMYDIEFLVICGNHDINSSDAVSTENGETEAVRTITADEFKEVYANLGYDLAIAEYTDTHGQESGYLSYVAELEDGYRLIAVDSCIYTFDDSTPQTTGGYISDSTMAWIQEQAELAIAEGDTPILMMHHRLSDSTGFTASIMQDFVVYDYLNVAESFASFGINFAFTGHLHNMDVGVVVNDDGQVLYDCDSSSVVDFPNQYREMTISTYESGLVSMEYTAVDFDSVSQYTKDGITYDNSSYKYTSFQTQYGEVQEDGSIDVDITYLLTDVVVKIIDAFIEDVEDYGSIMNVISDKYGLDLKAMLDGFLEPYLGDGIDILGYTLFSTDNIIWFIEDLLDQVYDVYLEDPTYLYEFIEDVIRDAMSIVVSEYPSTAFTDYGLAVDSENGTLGDLLLTVLAYWYVGNEDASDDIFIQDVLASLYDSSLTITLIDYILETVVETIVEDELLSNIKINISALLNDDCIMSTIGDGIDFLIESLLLGNNSYMNLVNVVFSLGILEYTCLMDVLDDLLLQDYLTDETYETISLTLTTVIEGFTTDDTLDYDVTYTNAIVEVEASEENYRLPTMIEVTLDEEDATSANISWYSKSTVGGAIEIYKASDDGSEPTFIGEATVTDEFNIDIISEVVEYSYPGINLGFMGFLNYYFDMNLHSVSLTGLEAGATYYYRLGDADKDWWSETLSLTIAADDTQNDTQNDTDVELELEIEVDTTAASAPTQEVETTKLSTETTTATTETTTSTTTTTTTESESLELVPETGDTSAVLVAISTLSISAAAAYVCLRKKQK